MRLEVVTSLTRLMELEGAWWDVWRASGASPFQTPAWLMPWLEAFTRDPALCSIAVHSGAGLEAVLPLFAFRYHGEKIAAPLGIGISDYLDVVVRRGSERDVRTHLSQGLAEIAREVDRVLLEDVPGGSPLHAVALSWGRPVERHQVCPRISLLGRYSDYERGLPRFLRRNLERGRRKLSALGRARFAVADARSLGSALDALFELHAARWRARGEPGVLADENVRAFHRLAMPRLFSAGLLRFWLLERGDRALGAAEVLVGDSVCYYMTGYDPSFSDVSVGSLIAARTIEDAYELGRSSYDFLRGNEQYKYSFGARDEVTYKISLVSEGRSVGACGAPS